jgi:SAM-dependent methyltransferase
MNSHGYEVEKEIESIIINAVDRSSGSRELVSKISSWPTFYHLSPERSNILRPLTKYLTGNVLEIGCGCGALTRFIGEHARKVVALDPASRRASIAARRCEDLANVMVVPAALQDFNPSERFDTIVCVGVLEYSPQYTDGSHPIASTLDRIRDLLCEDGVLIIGIENQLGLRYFAGFPEEHVSTPFYGIESLYKREDAITFGYRKWLHYLGAAGFTSVEFLYPFPDYKSASVIVRPDIAAQPGLDIASMISVGSSEPYREQVRRSFSERAAWRAVVENGALQEFANSFLIVCSPTASDQPADTALAYVFSTNRVPGFCKQTTIVSETDDLIAMRAPLYHTARSYDGIYELSLANEPVLRGTRYDSLLAQLLLRAGWTVADVASWARLWYEFLRAHAWPDHTGPLGNAWLLPNNFVDCIPANLVLTDNGELNSFDLEYRCRKPLRLEFVLFRGLCASLGACDLCAPPALGVPSSVVSIARDVMSLLGIDVEESRVRELVRLEAELQYEVADIPVEDTERKLTQTQLPLKYSEGVSSISAPILQVFWRSEDSSFNENDSASAHFDASGVRQLIRLRIPPHTRATHLRIDVANRPLIFRDLTIQVQDALGGLVWDFSTASANSTVILKDIAFALGSERLQYGVSFGEDPYLEIALEAEQAHRLEQGGVLTCKLTPVAAYERTQAHGAASDADVKITALRETLAHRERDLARARLEAATLRVELEKISEQARGLEEAREALRDCRSLRQERENELNRLRSGFDAAQAAIAALSAEHHRFWKEFHEVQNALEEANRRLKEHTAVKADLAATQARLNAVLNSVTWRLNVATVGRVIRWLHSIRTASNR